MHIEIAERLRPFSHQPGIFFVLPGSNYRVQVFPACLKIEELSNANPELVMQMKMDIKGPVNEFTAEQDLEKGLIRVWGFSSEGFFRYNLKATQGVEVCVMLHFEKAPAQGIAFRCTGKWSTKNYDPLQAGECRLLGSPLLADTEYKKYEIPLIDRLSLGNHKSQDWDLIRRRRDFSEIFPLWHRLGQLVPKQTPDNSVGTLSLFENCRKSIEASSPEHILKCFEKVFLAGFEGGLSPRLIDSDFQGILENDQIEINNASPMNILIQGSELIRSLFVKYDTNSLVLLPACPPEFHCGRLINVFCHSLGIASIEWTKKSIRCIRLIAEETKAISLLTHDGQKRCRVRQSFKDRGISYCLGDSFNVVAGQNYWFDNFVA